MIAVDIDECAVDSPRPHTCGSGICENLDGTYACVCNAGYLAEPLVPETGVHTECNGKFTF